MIFYLILTFIQMNSDVVQWSLKIRMTFVTVFAPQVVGVLLMCFKVIVSPERELENMWSGRYVNSAMNSSATSPFYQSIFIFHVFVLLGLETILHSYMQPSDPVSISTLIVAQVSLPLKRNSWWHRGIEMSFFRLY